MPPGCFNKVLPPLRAVLIAFHRMSAVAHKERAFDFIMIASDYDKIKVGNPRPAHLIWRGVNSRG